MKRPVFLVWAAGFLFLAVFPLRGIVFSWIPIPSETRIPIRKEAEPALPGAPESRIQVETGDGAWIVCDVYDRRRERVVVISPGFMQHKRSSGIRELVRDLYGHYDVIAMDYRGTGESSGYYTYTAREQRDLDAVLGFARRRWAKVGVIGISLGAAIAINELASHPLADSLVTISAPTAYREINKYDSPELAVQTAVKTPLAIRTGSPFLEKQDPIAQVGSLAMPVLFIHGGLDRFVDEQHSVRLYRQASGKKELLIFPNAGHAHELILAYRPECARVIQEWFDQTLG